MNTFWQDIHQQPQSLRHLIDFYSENQEWLTPEEQKNSAARLLTGMGASFHSALITAFHFKRLGIEATAVEATDLLFYDSLLQNKQCQLIYVSQSGASVEVDPLTSAVSEKALLVAVTNNPESVLAHRANIVLPILAGTETAPVASKTYLNTLATLWLLARWWRGGKNSNEIDELKRIADNCETLVAQSNIIANRWLNILAETSTLLFLGHGPHAATAKQAAMMINEWVKKPALGLSIGAFRHGPIEMARPGLGVVIFAAPGITQRSAWTLADELEAAGASVLLVEAGQTRLVSEHPGETIPIDEFLIPILDIIPAQLFTKALAQHLGVDTTFRHINKVITRL